MAVVDTDYCNRLGSNTIGQDCFIEGAECGDCLNECFSRESSVCNGTTYSDRYDDASAVWVVLSAILMFFMKAGFLLLEESFSKSDRVFRRRVMLAKYVDIFAGTFGFWLFGYALSGNTNAGALGEEQDYIFWFFRFTFASNTATIIGGTLVGQGIQMRIFSVFIYAFTMTAFIHPSLARFFWSAARSDPRGLTWSPYEYCNGTLTANRGHDFSFHRDANQGDFFFVDFAGSGLVHLCGGMGGLVLSIFHKLERSKTIRKAQDCCPLLRRSTTRSKSINVSGIDEPDKEEKPKNFIQWMYPSGGGEENVENAALGILILWTTWFAFNAGSTEAISGKKTHAAVGRIALTMCLSAASGGLTQTIVSALVQIYKRDETFNANEIANGVLASLVAVTGCCPFVEPPIAILIGVLTIAFYHLGCYFEYLLGLHDGARVFPVHGVSGFWGVLCVGIFGQSCFLREVYENLCYCLTSELPGSVDSHGLRFAFQLAGGLFIIVWSFTLCFLLFSILWFFPVKFALNCLPWVFCFKDHDNKRGEIKFEGNILFTHFGEIGAPPLQLAPEAQLPAGRVAELRELEHR